MLTVARWWSSAVARRQRVAWPTRRVVDSHVPWRELAKAPYFDDALVSVRLDPQETRRAHLVTPLGRDERLDVTIAGLERVRRRALGVSG